MNVTPYCLSTDNAQDAIHQLHLHDLENMPSLRLHQFKTVQGVWCIPGSKSLSNRLLLLAALCAKNVQPIQTKSIDTHIDIHQVLHSEDTLHMLAALRALGVKIETIETIEATQTPATENTPDCKYVTHPSNRSYRIHNHLQQALQQALQQSNLNQSATQSSTQSSNQCINIDLFMGNAGTVMRPLLAVLALLPIFNSSNTSASASASLQSMQLQSQAQAQAQLQFTFTGIPRMYERPIGGLVDALRQLGASITYLQAQDYPPLVVQSFTLKQLPAKIMHNMSLNMALNMAQEPVALIEIDASLSSQFLSGLLMALPLLTEHYACAIAVQIKGERISQPYVDMTLACMAAFGVDVEQSKLLTWDKSNALRQAAPPTEAVTTLVDYFIPAAASYQSPDNAHQGMTVEADASSASYAIAAGLLASKLGDELIASGIAQHSIQGDIAFIDAVQAMNGRVTWLNTHQLKVYQSDLIGAEIDCINIPDAAMTLAILAVFAKGATTLHNIASWKVKETNRILAIAQELTKLGVVVTYGENHMTIQPPTDYALLQSTDIQTYNDHRMAMCFSLFGFAQNHGAGHDFYVDIVQPSCVAKTYTDYFSDLAAALSDRVTE